MTTEARLRRVLAIVPWIVEQQGPTIDEVCARFGCTEAELVKDLEGVLFFCGVHPFTPGDMVEVDISDRKLRVFQGDQLKTTHDVAVGTEKWPTPTGSWEFHRVDLNPEWNPPKSEDWAKEEERQAPGSADNPMGRARLVYRMPNTVHGTDDLNSLGKASSHGSIRVANEVVLELAEMLLKAGHAWEGPQWFQQMTQSRTEEYQIKLEQRIPIEVQE